MPVPTLAIIIPTLNEAKDLPLLLGDLARQDGIDCEVIVSDGGSGDATGDLARSFFADGRLSGKVVDGPRGRGRQLNRGARQSSAPWLLFLHADCRLPDAGQLRNALETMQAASSHTSGDAIAGRFALRFDVDPVERGYAYMFYEAKARLGRPGCIHGDQGLLLGRSFFERIGPFREDLPVMEDTALAEEIRAEGRWLLLPGEIVTSARRFAVEGLRTRQTLNALLMNFHAIGWPDFICLAPDVYRQQDRAKPLQLAPFLRLITGLLRQLPWRRRLAIWRATGGYVRSQAWQLGLALDCRRAWSKGADAATLENRWLDFFDQRVDPLTDHAVGRELTALLVWGWFHWQKLRAR